MLYIDSLTKTTKEKVEILKKCNLFFPNEGLFSICGKSGCGKSTLLNIIGKIDKDYIGTVSFNEIDIKNIEDTEYLQNIVSIVFQDFNLIKDKSVYENIAIAFINQKIDKKELSKRIEDVSKELHINELLNKKASELSGGQIQRVAIARAIVKKPKIILCDEPTGNLDRKHSTIIMEILKSLSKRCLIILVSHDLELVNKFSDGIYSMVDGSIIQTSSLIISNGEKEIYKDKHRKSCFANLKYYRNKITLISAITLQILYIFVFSCFLLTKNINKSINTIYDEYISSNVYTVSEVIKITNNQSGLNVEKHIRPDLEALKGKMNSSIILDLKFDYIINKSKLYNNGKEIEGIVFEPFYDNWEEKYYANFPIDNKNLIFSLKAEEEIRNSEEIFSDIFSYSKQIDCKIIEEKSVIQIPTIYYPYNYFSNMFRNTIMNEKTKIDNNVITRYDFIYNANASSDESSYGLQAFCDDENEIRKLNIENLKFTNNSQIKADSLISQMQMIKYYLWIFTFFMILISIVIIVFLIRFLLNDKKKEILVLLTQGLNYDIISSNICIIFLISSFAALLLTPIIAYEISSYVGSFFMLQKQIFNINVYVSMALTLIVISFVICFAIFGYTCILLKKINLAKELRCQ